MIPATLQHYRAAFVNCNRLERIIFEEGVTEISGKFSNCPVKEIILPESLRTIGDYAFEECEYLETVTLPPNVRSIGARAFYKSGLTDIVLNEGLSYIGEEAFYRCENLKCIYLPASITTMQNKAVGSNASGDFVAYFAESCSAMEKMQGDGVNCQIGTRTDP